MGDNKQNNKQTEFSDTNMAGTRTERKDEGDGVVSEGERRRMEAEKEFLERQYKERKLSRTVRGDADSAASSQMESESETDTRWSPNDGGNKAKSRKVEETEYEDPEGSDDDDELHLGLDPLENLGKTLRKMRNWFKLPQIVKMVKKSYASKFEEYMDEVQEQIVLAREERAVLGARVEEEGGRMVQILRTAVREELRVGQEGNEARNQATFAQALGRKEVPKITGVKGPVLPVPKLVVVKQENKESEEIKRKLKELVKPSEIGLKVRRLRMIRNGVIIESESEEGVENLLKSDALKSAGMTVEKPTKKNPMVMVYDINPALSNEAVKAEIYKRNMHRSEIEEEDFNTEFTVKHKYQEKTERRNEVKRNHMVAEYSVRVRNWLRRKGRVYIEWESCRIKDYVDLARCYKCQRFVHVAKFCTNDKPSCSHCAKEHVFKDCKNTKKEEARCANCSREDRLDARHPASWRGCPAYEKAVKRYNEQIDYGI
ncbi:uncharacterized protein LOC124362614 [Homalodisca vitripennis]|uniref:uncharacterized protein LOC124362614 n=1 Tax=Homalodisca vitripennis TaxID=197043 RepID=UPI001EEC31B7|nr:uncharacterized protein LOC124362614 [Homalodisca vitripennis]